MGFVDVIARVAVFSFHVVSTYRLSLYHPFCPTFTNKGWNTYLNPNVRVQLSLSLKSSWYGNISVYMAQPSCARSFCWGCSVSDGCHPSQHLLHVNKGFLCDLLQQSKEGFVCGTPGCSDLT